MIEEMLDVCRCTEGYGPPCAECGEPMCEACSLWTAPGRYAHASCGWTFCFDLESKPLEAAAE